MAIKKGTAASGKVTAVKKAAASKKVSEPEKKEVLKKAPAPPIVKYVCVIKPMYHPFQRVHIPTAPPGVILEEDSWVECQLEAGLMRKI